MTSAPAARASTLLVLFAVAAGYFALGCTLTLEWGDEGHLIYQSWRVSNGALPYRDALHLYAPSVFLVNGLLLHLCGPQLLVIRASLVLLKAVLAALVYQSARQLASWPFALAVYALFVAMWGAPMWLFNAPYASHYAFVAVLVGVLAFLQLRQRAPLRACALAGVCFGVATTFKQTSGFFAFAAFVLYLLLVGLPGTAARLGSGSLVAGLTRLARAGALLGVLALGVAYLSPRTTPWNVVVLLTPMALAIVFLGADELRRAPGESAPRVGAVVGMLCCGLAMLVPIAAFAIWFASRGLLGALMFNTVAGLPQLTQWFVPVPYPDLRSLLTLAMALLALTAARAASRSEWSACLAVVVALAAAALLFAWTVAADTGLSAWLRNGGWQGDVLSFYFYLPFVAVLGALPFAWRNRAAGHLVTSREWTSAVARQSVVDGGDVLALFWTLGATSLLYLYPAGDFWHVIMTMPLTLPLIAFLLERLQRIDPAPALPQRTAPVPFAFCVAALLAVLAAVPVLSLLTTMSQLSALRPAFARARGVVSISAKYDEVARLVDYLATEPAGRSLVVTTNEQMLYFLADRVSALDKYEFVFYLVGAGLIRDEDARALAPQDELVAQLERARPLVIDDADNPSSAAMRRAFPQVAAYLDQYYRTLHSVGGYRVLDQAAADDSPPSGSELNARHDYDSN